MRQDTKAPAIAGKEIALAVCLGVILLAISYVRLLGDTGSAAFRTKIIDAALTGPVWGTALGNNLVIFGATQLAVHIAFAFCCWGIARLSIAAWPASKNSACTWTLLWFLIGTGWLLTANAAYFRWSSLGNPYAELVSASWYGLSVISVYTVTIIASLSFTLISALRQQVASSARRRRLSLGFVSAGAAALLALLAGGHVSTASSDMPAKPHVILIGLDSLRSDAVRQSPSITPTIDHFLDTSVNFTDATTPLARTFPAWASIITGRHPHTTGAVMNLLPKEMIQTGDTLPQILGNAGYKTVYAIDEVRFSNLDRTYGFDEMIAPPIGATDFLLGFFGDTPLSNLLANSPVGEWLFPYVHANRAVAHAYDPDSFVNRLDRNLRFDEPTFLAVHLTLAHWPFSWHDAPIVPNEDGKSAAKHLYDPAVRRLDRQFMDVMAVLQERGGLKNAIVVVLSDHGESLGTVKSTPGTDETRAEVVYEEASLVGHGTSVFSRHQYQVVLAFKSYGETPLSGVGHGAIGASTSLEDITPTILDVLDIPATASFDGVSLMPLLNGEAPVHYLTDRIRFTETEFNPQGILPGQVVSASALFDAATYYRVDPETDRVLIKKERLKEIMASRQYAAFRDNKLLAMVPVNTQSGVIHRPLLATENNPPLYVPDPGNHSDPEVVELWSALQARFPNDDQRHAAPRRVGS